MLFNTVMFVFGFAGPGPAALPAAQPGRQGDAGADARSSTRSISFLTNTNLQHYSGEEHLSYFSQLFFICWNMFVSPSVGFCALLAIIRGLRGDTHMGNFYVDMWRGVGLRVPAAAAWSWACC